MAAERRVVGKDAVVADHAIVGDVAYAMNRLSSPIRVTPWSCTVPRFRVTHSRITLRSPISSRVASSRYFLSWGAEPTEANWKTWLSAPSRVGPG